MAIRAFALALAVPLSACLPPRLTLTGDRLSCGGASTLLALGPRPVSLPPRAETPAAALSASSSCWPPPPERLQAGSPSASLPLRALPLSLPQLRSPSESASLPAAGPVALPCSCCHRRRRSAALRDEEVAKSTL